jgi:hypothetical protein
MDWQSTSVAILFPALYSDFEEAMNFSVRYMLLVSLLIQVRAAAKQRPHEFHCIYYGSHYSYS